MSLPRRRLIWPIAIAVGAVLLNLLVGADVRTPARVVLALAFMLLGPGMAYVPLLRLDDRVVEIVLAIALSLVIDLLVTLVMVYGRIWSPEVGLSLLILVTTGGLLAQLAIFVRGRAGSVPR